MTDKQASDKARRLKNTMKTREWRENNRAKQNEYNRKNNLKKLYGITPEQYIEILLSQNGVCRGCLKPETAIDKRYGKIKSMAVDHDHETGKVRGLLCTACNQAIGHMHDSSEVAFRLALYLKENE